MDHNCIKKAVKIISEQVLTPVIYLLEAEGEAEFICFCDRNITLEQLYQAEQNLESALDQPVRILDIREFCEADRMEVMEQAELIHSEDPMLRKVFEFSMLDDYKQVLEKKQAVLDRMLHCDSLFLS